MPGEDRASSWPVPAATSSSRTARERPEICQALGGVSRSTLYRALELIAIFSQEGRFDFEETEHAWGSDQ
jgi:hypothetical protein